MRGWTRILVFVFAGVLALGIGSARAQDKPATQDKPAGQDKKETAAADPISGDWEGTVETPNGAMAFTLSLKLDKEKVSGDIGNQEGTTPITGTWQESKLNATFDYNGNAMVMTGEVKEGALTGAITMGQTPMNYTAKRKAK